MVCVFKNIFSEMCYIT